MMTKNNNLNTSLKTLRNLKESNCLSNSRHYFCNHLKLDKPFWLQRMVCHKLVVFCVFLIITTGCTRLRTDENLNSPNRYGNSYSYEQLIISDNFYNHKDISGAVEHIKRAIKADKNDYLLKVILAKYLIELGEFKKAKRQLQTAALFAPSSVEVKLASADLFYKQGNIKEALKCANIAVSLNNDNPTPLLWLGGFYQKNNPQKAVSYYNLALKIDPHNLQSHKQLIKLYQSLNNIKMSNHHNKRYKHLLNPIRS